MSGRLFVMYHCMQVDMSLVGYSFGKHSYADLRLLRHGLSNRAGCVFLHDYTERLPYSVHV